jgi:CRISPR-associated endonuclease/helicase Cas3
MTTIYSHAKKDKDGKKVGSKKLRVHTKGVGDKSRALSSPINSQYQLSELVDEIAKYHDLGKYTPYFQTYLLENGKIDWLLKQHAKFGAYTLYEKYRSADKITDALWAMFVIVHHHGNLTDFCLLKRLVEEDSDDNRIFLKQYESIRKIGSGYFAQIEDELSETEIEPFIKYPDKRSFRRAVKSFLKNSVSIEAFYVVNYLYSLLIEADKLDASNTEIYERKPLTIDTVDSYLGNSSSNNLRNQVRKKAINRLLRLDLEKQRLFTLTAPTGVGKTFIALDIAIKLRNIVPRLKNAQIIYALPFINIIEQGLDEYQKAIGDKAKILAHYQYADVFGDDPKANFTKDANSQSFDEGLSYNQKLMELDTWQSDIIITSFVQFFHTLIGYKNKLLKKFSHLANSIIILDEVQTLKLSQLPLFGAAIYYLSKYLNAYVILMTATKPKILELAYEQILKNEGEPPIDFNSLELLQGNKSIYKSYKRTKIVSLVDKVLKNEEEPENAFVENYFGKKWKSVQSCIVVVNKVNRCIAVFEKIEELIKQESYENPVYCLSTNIIPAQRFEIIQQIKRDLLDGECPILIATQVVEAGVNLDFDMGFRDVGPIDSIIQVAGRINREADPQNPENPHLPLYIIEFGDCQRIYGKVTETQALKALSQQPEFLEAEYLDLVETYFDNISDRSSFDESLQLFDAMKNLRYNGDSSETHVADFALIEDNKNTTSVFVLSDERAFEAKAAYEKLIRKELTKEYFDANFKRDFHQRIIAVPKYYCEYLDDFNKELNVDYLKVAEPENYNHETGFIRKTVSRFDNPTECL